MLGREYKIALEEFAKGIRDMVSIIIVILHSESKVDQFYLVKMISMVFDIFWIANHDIIKLHIVIGESRLMNQLDLVKQFDTNIVAAVLSECFISLEQMSLHGFTELFLDNV